VRPGHAPTGVGLQFGACCIGEIQGGNRGKRKKKKTAKDCDPRFPRAVPGHGDGVEVEIDASGVASAPVLNRNLGHGGVKSAIPSVLQVRGN